MNPDQIAALIKDLQDRAAQHAASGNAHGQYYYDCAVDIIRDHAAQAERSTLINPDLTDLDLSDPDIFVIEHPAPRSRGELLFERGTAAKQTARQIALGLKPSVRIPV